MFEYPAEIFGAKMREEKFGPVEEQYILYCYDIFGGTYSVRVDDYFISSRFDYGDFHSSNFCSRDGFRNLCGCSTLDFALITISANSCTRFFTRTTTQPPKGQRKTK